MYTIREIVICKQTKRINPLFKFDSRFDLNQLLDASVCSAALLMVVVLFFNFFLKMIKGKEHPASPPVQRSDLEPVCQSVRHAPGVTHQFKNIN